METYRDALKLSVCYGKVKIMMQKSYTDAQQIEYSTVLYLNLVVDLQGSYITVLRLDFVVC